MPEMSAVRRRAIWALNDHRYGRNVEPGWLVTVRQIKDDVRIYVRSYPESGRPSVKVHLVRRQVTATHIINGYTETMTLYRCGQASYSPVAPVPDPVMVCRGCVGGSTVVRVTGSVPVGIE